MASFLLAVQFLTVLPLGLRESERKKLAGAAVYFPIVGLLLGFLLSGINMLLVILNFSSLSASILTTVALIAITGGMHLDGLSDTADAFLSGKPKEEMLAIMRDSHAGVMGMLSLISVILLKIGLLSSLGASLKITALLLMCALSRWSAALAMFLFPYARSEGKARVFLEGMNAKIFFFSTIIAFICAWGIWQIKGLVIFLCIAGCTYLAGKFSTRKIGGITGDTLGANIELMEVISLFFVCVT
ncbi:MAG: cobalamin 5'-phosphate synthase [Omnitrophica WOR_2 bacterium RIFCSPLOWO2_12_FULL_51_8]|nr:MAG: cobalamin 5'-phosphate synthase [Omnitrophica WOR_2 bacterium RIFCSPLOWO2_12_FULL_51_8]